MWFKRGHSNGVDQLWRSLRGCLQHSHTFSALDWLDGLRQKQIKRIYHFEWLLLALVFTISTTTLARAFWQLSPFVAV